MEYHVAIMLFNRDSQSVTENYLYQNHSRKLFNLYLGMEPFSTGTQESSFYPSANNADTFDNDCSVMWNPVASPEHSFKYMN